MSHRDIGPRTARVDATTPTRRARGVRPAGLVALVLVVPALVLAVALAVGALAGCGSGGGSGSGASASPSGPVVFTVVGAKATKSFTLAELKAMPAYTGYAGIKDSVGVVTAPVQYTGVALDTLTSQVGGVDPAHGVTVLAKDGYGMTFSATQAAGGGFTTYDPVTGAERPPALKLTMLLAYESQGKPLDPAVDGPLRLVFAEPKVDIVVDGHWSVRWVDKVAVKKSLGQWSVSVQGATRSTLTQSSYVSCASPGCHGNGYTDKSGSTWQGVPLWLVVGSVDDGHTHGAGAFNRALAAKGYRIELIAQNGVTTFLSSRDLIKHKDWILAGKVGGDELSPDEFPLRLVGPGLTDDESIGRITKVLLRFK
jgi:DMSO/TMAO reductase YedYZ molybdopterin-dependent catalytic subunit